jgi:hypothetical protein
MYLGTIYISTEFRPDRTSKLIMAARQPSWKSNMKCYYSWTNGWIISKFLSWVHLIRIHDMIPGFLIWPTFWRVTLTHRGQSSRRHRYGHVSLLFGLEHSNLVWTTCIARHHLHFYWISARSAILENQQSAIIPELMAGSSPNFNFNFKVHLIRMYTWHDIWVFYLTCFLKIKVQNVTDMGTFHYYLTYNILTLCEHVSRHHLHFYWISARFDFKYGRQVAILERKNKVLYSYS